MGRTGKGLPVRMAAHLCTNDEAQPTPRESLPNARKCAMIGAVVLFLEDPRGPW